MTTPIGTDPVVARLRSHIPALDGIRGFAVLIVIVHHLAQNREVGTGIHRILMRLCEVGWSGVDLFFVLSGFLITGILVEMRGRRKAIPIFYARRTLRIFPLYYLSLLALIVIWPAFSAQPEAFQEIRHNQVWYWTYFTNVLISLGIPLGEVSASHFWSLAVEEQFYLAWPFVVLFAPRKRLVQITLAMIVGALLFRISCYAFGWGHSPAYVLTFSRLDALGMGALIALILRDANRRAQLSRFAPLAFWIATAAFVLVVVVQGSFRRGPLMLTVGLSFLAITFGLLIADAALGRSSLVRRVLEGKVLRFFGKYSYAMYIIHPFVFVPLENWFPLWSGRPGEPANVFYFIGYTLLGLAATSVAALISWNLFERWFLDLKKYFEPGQTAQAVRPQSTS